MGSKSPLPGIPVAAVLTHEARPVLRGHVRDLVRRQIGRTDEPASADGTFVRFLSGMEALVSPELAHLREIRSAEAALKRSNPAVGGLVYRKMRTPEETLPADRTPVGPDSGMRPEMFHDVAGLAEGFPAQRAREGSLVGVGASVVPELADGAETLGTRAALVRLLSRVNSPVND